MHVPRSTQAIAVGLALAALAPASAIADQDLRSPDARDAAVRASAPVDLRSPDARDAAARVSTTPSDLRSPDTRDAAQGRGPAQAPTVMIVRMPQSARADGLDWGDAGIGAGGVIALVALGSGATVLVRRRRHVGPIAAA
jgi:hypothetical protein